MGRAIGFFDYSLPMIITSIFLEEYAIPTILYDDANKLSLPYLFPEYLTFLLALLKDVM